MTEALPKLHILLCLGADFDCGYIPHLCRHYAGSVDSWNILLHSRQLEREGAEITTHAARLFENTLSEMAPESTLRTSTWLGQFNPYTKVERLNELAGKSVQPGEWIIHVDADELIEAPHNGFKALQAQCIASGEKIMYGVMIDRFALDRKPHPIHEDDDLFVKFPLSEEFTRNELQASTHKPCVMIYEGLPPLNSCHDYSGYGWKEYQASGLPILKVWHFKWIEATREKLRYRVGAFKQQRIGWWTNSANSLKIVYPDKPQVPAATSRQGKPASDHPYRSLGRRGFWKTGLDALALDEVWMPKWPLAPEHKVATFGSCFARYLGPALRQRSFSWLETEPAPVGLSQQSADRFSYGLFSCRTGAITTPRLLNQWINWSLGSEQPPEEYWVAAERVIDPFRPTIEPGGFESLDEMLASRKQTLVSMKQAIEQADVFLFTLGMTEGWINSQAGFAYPACPGTIAGRFDADQHEFVNLNSEQVSQAMVEALSTLWAVRPNLKVLLTVSPVPLTATASGDHVLPATSRSKSILRSVADELARFPDVDYFPSYELVMAPTPLFGQPMFEENQRSVSAWAVQRVMDVFFTAQGVPLQRQKQTTLQQGDLSEESQADCDDAWAEAFAR